jgi:tRNA-splicing ligase RtcB
MQLAGDYAYAGRDYVIDTVLEILGAQATLEVHNHHNYAWLENGLWIVRKGATPLTEEPAFIGGSMGEGAVVVRGKNTIGLSIFAERGASIDANGVLEIGALGSAPHGAGRVMSRTQAAGKRKRSNRYGCPERDCDHWITPQQHDQLIRLADKTALTGPAVFCKHHPERKLRKFTHFEQLGTGVVDWPNVQAELRGRGIELRGAAADEAPEVYKNLGAVIAAHANIEVVHRLEPLGIVMAGPDVFDPYKD